MGALLQSGKLLCPYPMCKKTFEKPVVLTDTSQLVRETYYACPHCKSKIDIITDDPAHPRLVSVDEKFYIGQKEPMNCPHQFGYLRDLPDDANLPDECAVCPKVMQCFVRKTSK